MNSARGNLGGAGTTTAAIAFGGESGPQKAFTESWNGTNWTETTDLNTAIFDMGYAGSATAALSFGGRSPTTAQTEAWNVTGGVSTIETS